MLELSLREALAFRDSYVGTAHILLALTRVKEGTAARVMFDLGVDPEQVGGEVLRLRSAPDRGWEESAWDEPAPPDSRPAPTGVQGPMRATEVRAVVEVALTAAASKAMEEHRLVDSGDLLLALAEGWPEDLVTRVLAGLGIDADRLRTAVEAARRSE